MNKNSKTPPAERCSIWRLFENCLSYHSLISLKEDTEKAYRFYEGDQWHGIEMQNKDMLPVYNFIKPTVNYKVSMVAMNNMTINYSTPGKADQETNKIIESLNLLALQCWERLKMDSKCWALVRAAAIAGESFIYFFDKDMNSQIINNTDVFLGDETQADIQKQPYIIIAERRDVNDVIAEAKANGVSKEQCDSIIADNDKDNVVTTEKTKEEVKSDSGKCTCLLYFKLEKNGDLKFTRCTKHVVYQPEKVIKGYGIYPIASLVFGAKKGTARGHGEVLPLINNQIEVNRNLARRIINSKLTAYSRLVYASEMIANPKALSEVGTAIEITGSTVEDVNKYVKYISPAQMSPEAASLVNEIMHTSRELAGAGDAALGNIDPTQASGTSIIAVRDQAAIPLNEQAAAFKQLVEDIAKIWLKTFEVYGPVECDDQEINPASLRKLNPIVRIDVSNTSPFSKYAREQALERLFVGKHISFEEYVKSLDSDSSVPKSKLESILKARQEAIARENKQKVNEEFNNLPGTMAELEAEVEAAKNKYVDNSGEMSELAEAANLAEQMYGGV